MVSDCYMHLQFYAYFADHIVIESYTDVHERKIKNDFHRSLCVLFTFVSFSVTLRIREECIQFMFMTSRLKY